MPELSANRVVVRLLLLCVFGLPISQPVYAKGRLAIIIDDIGYNLLLGKRSVDLTGDFTLAILPFTPYGRELAERAHLRGKEIMLHAPMSNHHNYPLGRGGLVSGMQRTEFLAVLRQNLANIPHIKGVNNHMGSLLTEQIEPMRWLMQELKERNLYFVDSRTSPRTQALIMAEQIQLPSRRRDVFLDDQRDQRIIRQQLVNALQKAVMQGSAIAIGHPYPETLTVLTQLRPLLDEFQVELVSVSTLMPHLNFGQMRDVYTNDCSAPPLELWPQVWMPINLFDEALFKLPTELLQNSDSEY